MRRIEAVIPAFLTFGPLMMVAPLNMAVAPLQAIVYRSAYVEGMSPGASGVGAVVLGLGLALTHVVVRRQEREIAELRARVATLDRS